MECHNRTSRVRTVTAKAVAGKSGEYKLVADRDHEEEICQLQLVKSSNLEGDVLLEGAVHNGRVTLTKKNGLRTSPP